MYTPRPYGFIPTCQPRLRRFAILACRTVIPLAEAEASDVLWPIWRSSKLWRWQPSPRSRTHPLVWGRHYRAPRRPGDITVP